MLLMSIPEELCAAIVNEDLEAVKSLLKLATDEDVNVQDENGDTTLMRASSTGKTKIVELLLTHPGVNVNVQNEAGNTAFMYACRGSHDGIVKLLLNVRGLAPHAVNKEGKKAFHMATEPEIKIILHVNGIYVWGTLCNKTKLRIAVELEDAEEVERLVGVTTKEEINSLDEDGGDTVLMRASAQGCTAIVEMLLRHPAIEIDFRNRNGDTALMIVSLQGYRFDRIRGSKHARFPAADCPQCRAIAAMLLAHPNIDVNAQNQRGDTALMMACCRGNLGIVSLLLALPDIDINIQGTCRQSALLAAVDNGYAEAVTMLLADPRTDANLRVQNGLTAFMHAVNKTNTTIAELLLDHPSAALNLFSEYGHTGLSEAIRCISSIGDKMVKVLLVHPRIDVNAQDQFGCTALMKCDERQYQKCVQMLLDHPDIDVNVQDQKGRTALMRFCEGRLADSVQMLLNHPGVNISLRNQDGRTAFDLASSDSFQMTVALFHPFMSQNEPSGDNIMEDAPVASATPAPLVPPAALGVAQNPFDVDETQMQILQQAPPVLFSTEAEQQAIVADMVDGLTFQQVVQADEEDDWADDQDHWDGDEDMISEVSGMSEMGDTTVREADTVVEGAGEGHELVVVGVGVPEMQLRAHQNNPPAAMVLYYAHTARGHKYNDHMDDESMQTSPLFL